MPPAGGWAAALAENASAAVRPQSAAHRNLITVAPFGGRILSVPTSQFSLLSSYFFAGGMVASLSWYSGYIVSAPPRVGSNGRLSFAANSPRNLFDPSR